MLAFDFNNFLKSNNISRSLQLSGLGKVEFHCVQGKCQGTVIFEMFSLKGGDKIQCPDCHNEYYFNQDLIAKLKKFYQLISAVRDAQDILMNTNVCITVDNHEVKIPYRLLLTRMNTLLTLQIGDHHIDFKYRVEPLREADQALMQS